MNDNSEVELKDIFKIVFKQRKIVSVFGIIGLFFTSLYSLSVIRTWEGQFQILLSDKKEGSSSALLQKLSQIQSSSAIPNKLFSSRNSGLKTELVILKSPSVLLSVYNFVKESKEKNGEKINGSRFTEWFNKNLNIEFEEDTSVLNISYQDTDKDLIIPVLNKISNQYQKYSGKDRSRNLTQGIDFLKNQISIYNKKTKNSYKELQKYSNEYYLVAKVDTENNTLIINIEEQRIKAANKIRNINEKIKQLELYESNNSTDFISLIRSFLSQTPNQELSSNLQRLVDIEREIAILKSLYKNDDDEEIQALNKRKITLIDFIKEKTFKVLNAEKVNTKTILISSTRPDNVLFQYKNLLRDANRDIQTLVQLENEYRALTLESARIRDPWELITKPTVLKDPVGPRRKEWAYSGLLVGLLLGSSFVLVRKNLTGKIFTLKDIYGIVDDINLINFNKFDVTNSLIEIDLFFEKYIIDFKPKDISFLTFEEKSNPIYEDIMKIINSKTKASIVM